MRINCQLLQLRCHTWPDPSQCTAFQVRGGALVRGLALPRTQSMRTRALNPALLCNRAMRHGPCEPKPSRARAAALTIPTSTPTTRYHCQPIRTVLALHVHTQPPAGVHTICMSPCGAAERPGTACAGLIWPPASGGQPPHTLPIVRRYTLSATRRMRQALGTSSSSKARARRKPRGWGCPDSRACLRHMQPHTKFVRGTGNSLVRHERVGVAAAVSTAGSDLERACAYENPRKIWPCQAQSAEGSFRPPSAFAHGRRRLPA